MPTLMPRIRLPRVLPVLVSLVVLAASALAGGATDSDRWYLLKMADAPCGGVHTIVAESDGKVTTTSTMTISVRRGEVELLKIAIDSEFVETTDGKPVRMKSVQNTGTKPTTSTYTFQPDGAIELVTEQDGRSITKTLPKPEGVWLTPNAGEQFVKQRMKSGAKDITVRTIDPTAGVEPATIKYTGFEPVKVKVGGREVDAIKRQVTTQAMGTTVKSVDYVDTDGELVKSRMDLGVISIDMLASTAEEVAKAGAAPEVMVTTFCKPDKPIKDPRYATKAVLLLTLPEEAPEVRETGSQRVEKLENAVRLTISTTDLCPAAESDTKDAALLASTTLANLEDEKIKELAAKAVKGVPDEPAARAEACRQFVFRYIRKKNLTVAFASASDVARSREGDCTEHGVLLTALLRANGIPARAVVGLIYADQFAGSKGIFGYHMWSQALLTIDGKPRWVDLDGTLPYETPFDATHIALDLTTLADGVPMGGLGAIAKMLGRLEVKVESVEHAKTKQDE
jgi:hypothetical protein